MGVMMTGCSSEDNIQQTEKTSNQRTLTFNVGISDEGAGTRAVTADGTATFALGDRIAVIYTTNTGNYAKAVSLPLTAGDLSLENKNATFTVTVNDPDYQYDVRYIYPASMVNEDCTVNWAALDNQDGTLGALSRNLDYCEGIGWWDNDGAQYQLPYLSLANRLSILALTLKNSDGSNDLTNTITSLTLSDGDNTYKVKRDAEPGPIYMAIRPTSNATIEVTANSSSAYYSKSLQDKTYDSGHLFNLPWRMSVSNNIDLSKVYSDYEAKDGNVLTGTLGANVKISIAAGATVTLNNVTIDGTNNSNYYWAGLTCLGDATIILADGTTNSVKGFYQNYPGIYVPSGKTLIIKGETSGTGSLAATSNGSGAGIGGGLGPYVPNAGNININGGNITATGGDYSAGIGSGKYSSCGNISITGGSVTATGGTNSAGIGTGNYYSCGAISITGGSVTATGGANGAGIGTGSGLQSTCDIISITGGTIIANGGSSAASIGTGYRGTCSDITISDARVTATGGANGAGIGSGEEGTCSDITIMSNVIHVKATRGEGDTKHVGPGKSGKSGKVTIGDNIYWDGENYVTEHDGSYYLHECGWLEYQPVTP